MLSGSHGIFLVKMARVLMLTPSKSEHLARRIIVSKGDAALRSPIVSDYIVPARIFFTVNYHVYTLGLIFWPISGLVAIFKSPFALTLHLVHIIKFKTVLQLHLGVS